MNIDSNFPKSLKGSYPVCSRSSSEDSLISHFSLPSKAALFPKKIEFLHENQDRAAKKLQRCFQNFFVDRYIKKHFKFISKNCSSFREANVIYFGECHDKEIHALRIAKVIRHLYQDRDIVLVEGLSSKNNPQRYQCTYRSQLRYLEKQVMFAGWDYVAPDLIEAHKRIYFIGKILTICERSLFTSHLLPPIEEKHFLELFEELKGYLIGKDVHRYLDNPSLLKRVYRCSLPIRRCCLKAIILSAYDILFRDFLDKIRTTFPWRQDELVSKVGLQQKTNKTIFLVAGKDHLFDESKKKVEKTLTESFCLGKHIILLPRDDILVSKTEATKIALVSHLQSKNRKSYSLPKHLWDEADKGFHGPKGQLNRFHLFKLSNQQEISIGLFCLECFRLSW